MYFLGVDGGGTKVHALLGNENKEVISEGFGGPGNYQTCGKVQCKKAITEAIFSCLEKASVTLSEITYAVFGMSGYDEPIDFEVFDGIIQSIMGDVPHKVYHDSWIGLRLGSEKGYGVVSICGTGGATAGMNLEGEKLALRNLDYLLGNRGGGSEIIEKAIHYACRSNEGIGIKTRLEDILPKCFSCNNMEEMIQLLREEEWPSDEVAYKIPPAVFELALEGDFVSKHIIQDMAKALGEGAAGVIKRLNMVDEAVPCVLVGSLFKQKHPDLNDIYLDVVHKTAPSAYTVVLEQSPVYGAYYLALDTLKG